MKLITTILAIAMSLATATAAPPVLSTSPNGKYMIRVEQDEQLGLGYALVQVSSGTRLLLMHSSYQPSLPEYDGITDTAAANVYWSQDSRSVAIDEASVRSGGTVLAALLTAADAAEEIVLPFDKIVQLSGERWDRVRLGVDESEWGENGELHLNLVGTAWAEKVPEAEPKGEPQQKSYGVILKVRRCFEIKSLTLAGDQ